MRKYLKESPIILVSAFGTEVTRNQCLHSRNSPLDDPIYFL